ncbi:single-stranded-DNA-specific exonuclease RecJ [bacterium]|nr:MAG: single-stranded-DNA-specific exonuclease RecJ [bacterium]
MTKAVQVWDLPTAEQLAQAASLADAMDLPHTAAQALVRRGLASPDDATRFLELGPSDLHDPLMLAECGDAARRVQQAIEDDEKIVVHGDYDADGICGTALLVRGLRRLGALVEPFLPDRQRDGYGVAARLIDHAGERGVGLLITVDTGSNASTELARAAAMGIDVIVCDHHRFDERPAGVRYFLNPLREDSGYPHTQLCGAGVAQKLLTALHRLRGLDDQPGLDLAAIATVADQVGLNRENRALVQLGLEQVRRSSEPGLRALVNVCRIDGSGLDSADIGFQIAPRINAAGRIEKARSALDLLLATGTAEASRRATHLDELNGQRRELDRVVSADALEQAAAQVKVDDPAALVLWSEAWHRGVVGVSAAKVVEAFARPAMLFALEGDVAVGSARSVPGVDLKAALDSCAKLMDRYGGHAAAAGATLKPDNLPQLREQLAAAVQGIAHDQRPADHFIDALLQPGDLDPRLARFLYSMGPFGNGNRPLRLAATGARLASAPRLIKEQHLRLGLRHGEDELGVIAFGRARSWLPVASSSERLDVSFGLRHRPGSRWSQWEFIGEEIRAAGQESGESA